MRLIDADKFKTYLNEQMEGIKEDGNLDFKTECIITGAKNGVDVQPTVYDIDKVVRQLEEERVTAFITLANSGNEKVDFVYQTISKYLDNAIEIVKAGGVNE